MTPVTDHDETMLFSHTDSPARRNRLSVLRRHDDAPTPLVSRAIELARSGDRDALALLHARYADEVYEHMLAVTADEIQARTVTRRVFAELEELLSDRYEEWDAPFGTWIRSVARCLARTDVVDRQRSRDTADRPAWAGGVSASGNVRASR